MIPENIEIRRNGKTYFYNISLAPFHLFRHNGTSYLLNVPAMTSAVIDDRMSRILDEIRFNKGCLVPSPVMEELENLGLVEGATKEDVLSHPPGEKRPGMDDLMAKLMGEPVVTLSMNITRQCNLNCVYCYGNTGECGSEGTMDEGTATRAVDWLMAQSGEKKSVGILFGGGEPLMNFPLIRHVVAHADKKGKALGKEVRYGMTTNSTLLDDKKIAFLETNGITPLISFDGPEHIHNENRPFKNGRGSYGTVAENVEKLLKKIPGARCRATINRANDLPQIKKAILKAGFSSYTLTPAVPSLYGNWTPRDRGAEEKDHMREFLDKEADITFDAIRDRTVPKHGLKLLLGYLYALLSKQKRLYGCGAGRGYLGVSMKGDLFPCPLFTGDPGMRMGSVFGTDADREPYLRAMVTRLERCARCWAAHFCGGGCIYTNKAANGDPFKPVEAYCDRVKYAIEKAVSIFHRLDGSDMDFLKEKQKQIPGINTSHDGKQFHH
ncbi:MAG: radical SAM protein [Deltaproteobacteria bacterium]|jgi:uncharacterized protein|nr:radical SAM protein [Deltaproteobacteria bacterium]